MPVTVWEPIAGHELAKAVAARQGEIVKRLASVSAEDLSGPSRLPGWSCETVVCHLRYGAAASRAVTELALAGLPASFYPLGRTEQRPTTLLRNGGESLSELVASFHREAAQLDAAWAAMSTSDWDVIVEEPEGVRDLGPVSMWMLALLRLTEVEAHGDDLDMGLAPWSDTFVRAALPARLHWLPARRSNHRQVDDVYGTWVFDVTDGPRFVVTASEEGVTVDESDAAPSAPAARAGVFRGSGHQLLAFLLGRDGYGAPAVDGDTAVAAQFSAAFPPP